MRLTEAAADAILNVMKTKGLNPKKIFLEIGTFDGNLGIAFTSEQMGKTIKFGGLSVVVQDNVNSTGIVVDFGEVNGKKGLIFLGEEHVNHSNGKSGK